jgi:hypothetical protein
MTSIKDVKGVILMENKNWEPKEITGMGSNDELCTECGLDEAVVPLKDGRNMCPDCTEDWLHEEWEAAGNGYGVELDI